MEEPEVLDLRNRIEKDIDLRDKRSGLLIGGEGGVEENGDEAEERDDLQQMAASCILINKVVQIPRGDTSFRLTTIY